MVAKAMQKLHDQLFTFEGSLDGPWAPCGLVRADFENDIGFRYNARRQVLIVNGGAKRHWENKFAQEPYTYERFFSDEYSYEEQQQSKRTTLSKPLCCLGLAARNFRILYDTMTKLSSRACKLSVVHMMRTCLRKWHSLLSQLQHASDKKKLAAQARGRSWIGHGLKCVLSHSAVQHMESGGVDVRKGPAKLPSGKTSVNKYALGDVLDTERLAYREGAPQLTGFRWGGRSFP